MIFQAILPFSMSDITLDLTISKLKKKLKSPRYLIWNLLWRY